MDFYVTFQEHSYFIELGTSEVLFPDKSILHTKILRQILCSFYLEYISEYRHLLGYYEKRLELFKVSLG